MYLPRLIVIAVALPVMAGPVLADKKVTVCHNDESISISKNALDAHRGHGDRVGKCPPIPTYKAVAMIRCLNNIDGAVVVSGTSISSNTEVNPLNDAQEQSCADAVAYMMNNGYTLNQVNTGLTDGETEYLLIGKTRNK